MPDDMIYRQAAINLIQSFSATGYIEEETEKIVNALKELPSAQPEIIKCKDCKWYKRAYKHMFYRGMDCLNHRIATIVPDKDYCSRAERRTDATD